MILKMNFNLLKPMAQSLFKNGINTRMVSALFVFTILKFSKQNLYQMWNATKHELYFKKIVIINSIPLFMFTIVYIKQFLKHESEAWRQGAKKLIQSIQFHNDQLPSFSKKYKGKKVQRWAFSTNLIKSFPNCVIKVIICYKFLSFALKENFTLIIFFFISP